MARTKPNFLWRAMPTPRSVVDTCELQTLAYDNNTKKPEWLTVARGQPSAVEIIAAQLSKDRFRMFPLQKDEPGWPKDSGGMIDDEEGEETDEDEPVSGHRGPPPVLSGSALSGSTETHRKPAIRESASRRPLTGAAARSAERRAQREHDGHDEPK